MLMGAFLFTFRDSANTTPLVQKKESFAWIFLDIYFIIIGFNCYFTILSYRFRKRKGKIIN